VRLAAYALAGMLAGAGVYGAEYEFFMFGQWQLDTVVTTQGNRREFAVSVYVWPN